MRWIKNDGTAIYFRNIYKINKKTASAIKAKPLFSILKTLVESEAFVEVKCDEVDVVDAVVVEGSMLVEMTVGTILVVASVEEVVAGAKDDEGKEVFACRLGGLEEEFKFSDKP